MIMEQIQIFKNSQFGEIRTILNSKNEPMFCLSDISKALEYNDTDIINRILEYSLTEQSIWINDTIYVDIDICKSLCCLSDITNKREILDILLILNICSFTNLINNIVPNKFNNMLISFFNYCNNNNNKEISYTYIIYDKERLIYKIGRSKDISKRIKSMLTYTRDLIPILVISDDVEKELHFKYKNKNEFREWFSLTEKDICDIATDYSDKIILSIR